MAPGSVHVWRRLRRHEQRRHEQRRHEQRRQRQRRRGQHLRRRELPLRRLRVVPRPGRFHLRRDDPRSARARLPARRCALAPEHERPRGAMAASGDRHGQPLRGRLRGQRDRRPGRDSLQRDHQRPWRRQRRMRPDAVADRVERHRDGQRQRRPRQDHRPRHACGWIVRVGLAGERADQLREREPHGGHLLLAVGHVRRRRGHDGGHLLPRLWNVRSDPDPVLHVRYDGHLRGVPHAVQGQGSDGRMARSCTTTPTPTTSSATFTP